MINHTAIASTIAIVLFAVAVQAQAPTPGPEHKKLGFWIGKWKIEAEAKPNPLFPEGKYYATLTAEWFEGEHHVLCHYKWTGAMGAYSGLEILGYDSETNECYNYAIDSFGSGMVFKGTVKENIWTYTADMKVKGKAVKFRWSVVNVSADVITWKSELSIDGDPWILAGEAKATKM